MTLLWETFLKKREFKFAWYCILSLWLFRIQHYLLVSGWTELFSVLLSRVQQLLPTSNRHPPHSPLLRGSPLSDLHGRHVRDSGPFHLQRWDGELRKRPFYRVSFVPLREKKISNFSCSTCECLFRMLQRSSDGWLADGKSHETCLKLEAAWVTVSFLKSCQTFSFTLSLLITRKASSGQMAWNLLWRETLLFPVVVLLQPSIITERTTGSHF